MASSGQRSAAAADSSPEPATTNGRKRRRDDNGAQPQQRSKRNRYISIACNECKRRKIKCNGESPCQRCGNLNLECLYAPNCCSNNFRDSTEFKQMDAQIRYLQDQVNSLLHNITSLRQTLGQADYETNFYQLARDETDGITHTQMPAPPAAMVVDPALQRADRAAAAAATDPGASTQPNRFQGPTSSAFSLNVAKNSLEHMGISAAEDGGDGGLMNQGGTSAMAASDGHAFPTSKDAIWNIDREEALRLCRIFEDEIGLMYPVLDMSEVMQYATLLYTFVDAVQRNVPINRGPGPDIIDDEDTDILKVVLANALVMEGTGQNELAARFFTCFSVSVQRRLQKNVTIRDMQILVLTAMYHFHSDEETLAWRVIGSAARLSIEMGLHRAESYDRLFSTQREREQAIRTFWCIYVLDRRWSLGTGMSFAIHESDLDKSLPKPGDDYLYLNAMIRYSEIATKAWHLIVESTADSSEKTKSSFNHEQISYLDYQILQWKAAIPESLRFIHPNSAEYSQHGGQDPNEKDGRGTYRLRVLLYLRANQMRINIYRPVLHSSFEALKKPLTSFVDTMIDIAQDSVRVLRHVNQSTNLYRTQQMCFNYFLLSAIAVMVLAVAHAPEKYTARFNEEWHMASDLVRGLSATSYVSKRLYRTLKSMRIHALRVGFAREMGLDVSQFSKYRMSLGSPLPSAQNRRLKSHQQQQHPDAQRSAALAMAGLAGHRVEEARLLPTSASLDSGPPQEGGPNVARSAIAGDQAANGSGGGGDASLDSIFRSNGSILSDYVDPNNMAQELGSFLDAARSRIDLLHRSSEGINSTAGTGAGADPGTSTEGGGVAEERPACAATGMFSWFTPGPVPGETSAAGAGAGPTPSASPNNTVHGVETGGSSGAIGEDGAGAAERTVAGTSAPNGNLNASVHMGLGSEGVPGTDPHAYGMAAMPLAWGNEDAYARIMNECF